MSAARDRGADEGKPMRESLRQEIAAELLASARLKEWAAEHLAPGLAQAAAAVIASLQQGGKVLFCGNGGSAADSQHLAAELVGRYRYDRPGLPAIALTTDTSILTALGNDYGFDRVFARQVEALAGPADVLIAISTSGQSPNILAAVRAAKKRGATTIAFSGRDGGPLAKSADIALVVASDETPRIQECHIAMGHALCRAVEDAIFGKASDVSG